MEAQAREKVSWRLLPFQHLLLENKQKRYLALVGGVGSGKTFFGCRWHHIKCSQNYNSQSWVASHTYDQVKDLLYNTYLPMLEQAGFIENIHFTLNRSELLLHYLVYEHKVYFKSAVAYEKWKGANLSHALGDEPAFWPKHAFGELDYRLRGAQGDKKQFLCVGTPQGLTHFMQEFSGPQFKPCGPAIDLFGKDYNLGYESESRFVLHYPTYLNVEHVGADYIHAILDTYGHDPKLIRAHLLGEFCALFEKSVYKFSDENVKAREANPQLYKFNLMFDFNVGRMAWAASQLYQRKDENKQSFIIEEAPPGTVNTDEACDQILKRFDPKVWKDSEVVIDGDASGHSGHTKGDWTDYDLILQRLRPHYRRVWIRAPYDNGSIRSTVLATNRALSANEITGRPISLYVHPKCRYTIEAFYRTVYEEKGKDIKKTGNEDDWPTDRTDSVRYHAVQEFPYVEPKYRDHRGAVATVIN